MPAEETALECARKADEMLRTLRDVKAQALLAIKTTQGTARAQTRMVVATPDVFRIEYITLVDGDPHVGVIRADGKTRLESTPAGRKTEGKAIGPDPVSSPKAIPTGPNLAAAWPTEMSRLVLAGISDRQDVFVQLVNAITAMPGMKIDCYRMVDPKRPNSPMYNLAARYPTTNGECELRMTFDGTIGLPVTLQSKVPGKNGKPVEFFWTARWQHAVVSLSDVKGKKT